MANKENLDACFTEAERLVFEGGKLIADIFETEKLFESKDEDGVDLVTEYDRRIEETLVKNLRKKFPHHKFIGEEGSAKEGLIPEWTNEPTWIIDPIDGTTNFVHCFPTIGICVGFSLDKIIEFGIIYNPISNQFFSAKRGRGAFLNGKPIKTSAKNDLSQCLVGMEPWIAKDKNYRPIVYKRMNEVIRKTQGLRVIGSAAVALCYVAMGAMQAYHVESISAWDVAAAKVILEEAGGSILDTSGGDLDLMNPKVIAACNRQVADQLVELFKEVESKPMESIFQ